ncbi:MAG: RlmE family RNA methyltransferase [Spirochaetales bacterium]|nr:RlmE family RNA methyltransferase [Spirochaetales bacterium]
MSNRAKPDHWTIKAKKMGYPARSVFKLEEIQKKWTVMKRGGAILDVGAAPGSWSLYALRSTGPKSHVVAVDLKPLGIKAPSGHKLHFLQGDVFTRESAEFLASFGPYDCVLSDAAPSTSGNRLIDARKSYDLVMRVLDLACAHLGKGGNLVVKVFQGGDEAEIRDRIKSLFKEARTFKPKAVRSESMETYMVGIGFLGEKGSEVPKNPV